MKGIKKMKEDKNFIYYYLRDEDNHPRISVCLFRAPDKKIYRGISICSFLDVVSKVDGRNRARGRAIKAYLNQEDSEPIINLERSPSYRAFSYFTSSYTSFYVFKSCPASKLTDYEKFLVGKKWLVEQN
jgi:hypothetical protein